MQMSCRGSFFLGAALAVFASPSLSSAATLQVGPGKMYGKPCQAIAAAATGDVIEVDAAGSASYKGDTCAWSTDNLTVRGVNGRPKLDITGTTPAQQKGLYTIYATTATIENLEFTGAAISAAAGNSTTAPASALPSLLLGSLMLLGMRRRAKSRARQAAGLIRS
jgi:hypothetical protein